MGSTGQPTLNRCSSELDDRYIPRAC
jgi:hypothetical protein